MVNRVVDPKRIIGKNGGPKRRRGTRGCWSQKVCSPSLAQARNFQTRPSPSSSCTVATSSASTSEDNGF
jgi:hypothetical protein